VFSLQGQTAIVTGGSKGIGNAIALTLGLAGASVVIADIDDENGKKTSEQLYEKGIWNKFVLTDVTKHRDVNHVVDTTINQLGNVDILVNNAGILSDQFITDITEDEWDNMIDVHLKGTFLMCRAVVPHMLQRNKGKIINIASIGGLQGFPLAGVHYCAAKGGIMAFTRQLALQISKYNIHVNCVAPGTTLTDMMRNRSEEQLNNIMKSIPLKRLGMPEDTANAVLFLASPYADYIAGETIDVNGGKYMS
jgi:3-oxoacyl-[acyl-carrier protein] reductase